MDTFILAVSSLSGKQYFRCFDYASNAIAQNVPRTFRVPAMAPTAAAATVGCSLVPASWGALSKTRGDSEKAVGNVRTPLIWCILFKERQPVMSQLGQV